MARTSSRESGFTMVELMVVVLIIGILMTIAIPVYAEATAGAYSRSCQANQRTIRTAVITAQTFNEDTSGVGHANAVFDSGSGWGTVLIPNYLTRAPKCTERGGGLYNMTPDGDVVSDMGASKVTFVNPDHLLPENRPE